MASSTTKELETDIPNHIRVYKDGSVERLVGSPYVPPSLDQDPQTKDITISQNPTISARLYLPKLTQPNKKIPVFVYFHGGAFCIESAFSLVNHRYVNSIVSESQVLAASIEYRLAPEHPLPAAYEDCWAALQWVASHSVNNGEEPWILDHGDFDRVFIGGDSAGANIVHHIAMRAGADNLPGNVKILGAFQANPYFWGSDPVGNEPVENHDKTLPRLIWDFVYPSAPNGIDNPMINPSGPSAPSLARLGCCRLLVCVSGKDILRERDVWYYHSVKESGWKGEIELFEIEEEGHSFHLLDPDIENSKILIKKLSAFLKK